MSESKCRSCGAAVIFVPSDATGATMILDAEAVPDGNFEIVGGRAKYAGGGLFAQGRKLYRTHFSSCPNAKDWRRSKR